MNGFDTPQAQALQARLNDNLQAIRRYLARYAQIYQDDPQHDDRLAAVDAHLDTLVIENQALTAQLTQAYAVQATPDGWQAPRPDKE